MNNLFVVFDILGKLFSLAFEINYHLGTQKLILLPLKAINKKGL